MRVFIGVILGYFCASFLETSKTIPNPCYQNHLQFLQVNYKNRPSLKNLHGFKKRIRTEQKDSILGKNYSHRLSFRFKTLTKKLDFLKSRVFHLEKEAQKLETKKHFHQKKTDFTHQWLQIKNNVVYEPVREKKQASPHMLDQFFMDSNKKSLQLLKRIIDFNGNLKSISHKYFYYRLHPLSAVDVISKLQLKIQNGSDEEFKTIIVHQRQLLTNYFCYFQEPRGTINKQQIEMLIMQRKKIVFWDNFLNFQPSPTISIGQNTVVNFVMALTGRTNVFLNFMQNFENFFLKQEKRVNLFVSYFLLPEKSVSKPANDRKLVQEQMKMFQLQYPEHLLKLIVFGKDMKFSRGAGLQEASNHIKNLGEILFFCDVDLVFTSDILTRIRRNTVQGHRVYYPVFFSQYDPDVVYVEKPRPPTHFSFEELDGFWRYFSYGMLSIYKSDFDKTVGFNRHIRGWGLEDIQMVDAALEAHLDIFRSADPQLVHVYHDKKCDLNTTNKQYKNCLSSRASHFGSQMFFYRKYKAKRL